ncbi:hypothetical protein OUZ56_030511 [Daphnia magna]|uniref:Uncharacterized protein n=1 Tax=Daphnia magna TaxID=35525 RepID=A0ABQ9ZRK6_9CRUS|nr:hypothetical protein OUZ56_030511 [Daphnia magna]
MLLQQSYRNLSKSVQDQKRTQILEPVPGPGYIALYPVYSDFCPDFYRESYGTTTRIDSQQCNSATPQTYFY